MKVKLIAITPEAEHHTIYCARVSNPSNQNNPEIEKLLRYCINKGHWSIFEHAFMTLEIETSRAIATQILRHRSFSFQEFSLRYSKPMGFESIELRKQSEKNRQSSTEIIEDFEAEEGVQNFLAIAHQMYTELLHRGVAKECARSILPLALTTRLYMSGSVRSWIHYLQVRTQPDTQKEHREIALAIQAIFQEQLPTIGAALWS